MSGEYTTYGALALGDAFHYPGIAATYIKTTDGAMYVGMADEKFTMLTVLKGKFKANSPAIKLGKITITSDE